MKIIPEFIEYEDGEWELKLYVKTKSGRVHQITFDQNLDLGFYDRDGVKKANLWIDLWYVGENVDESNAIFSDFLKYKEGCIQLVVDEDVNGDPYGYLLIPVDHDSEPFYDEEA